MSSFLYNKIIAQRTSFVKFPLQHFACSSGNTAKNRKKERPMLGGVPFCMQSVSFGPFSDRRRCKGLLRRGSGDRPLRPRAALSGSLTSGLLPKRHEKPAAPLACGFLVPVTGIEPVRCFHRQILSLLRLPISPHRQILAHLVYHSPQENAREVQRNQAALGNMIQLRGAAPSRPTSRLRRLASETRLRAQPIPRVTFHRGKVTIARRGPSP